VTPDRQLVALVHAARAGDDAAWTGLVRRFDSGLREIARSYRLPPADVDDVLQATWIRLLRHIGKIREPAAIAGWLATTVRRESMRLLQRPVREQLVDDPALGDRPEPDGAEAAVLAAERRAVLARAVAGLPERHRRLMLLLASEAAPDYDRISAALDMPRGSIGPIRARCLARLERSVELRRLVGR
jgi:RNA polymerase sigma factor (sigma-70 family)